MSSSFSKVAKKLEKKVLFGITIHSNQASDLGIQIPLGKKGHLKKKKQWFKC